jgi:hypothetical protein
MWFSCFLGQNFSFENIVLIRMQKIYSSTARVAEKIYTI